MSKENYLPIPKYLELKESPIHGMGIFTKEDIPRKDFNYNIALETVTHYVYNNNLIRTPLGGFLNHSSIPNCRLEQSFPLQDELLTAYSIKPLRDIAAGEELTLDYSKELCGLHDYDDSFIKEKSCKSFFSNPTIEYLNAEIPYIEYKYRISNTPDYAPEVLLAKELSAGQKYYVEYTDNSLGKDISTIEVTDKTKATIEFKHYFYNRESFTTNRYSFEVFDKKFNVLEKI